MMNHSGKYFLKRVVRTTGSSSCSLWKSRCDKMVRSMGSSSASNNSGCLLEEEMHPNYTLESIPPSKHWNPQSEAPKDPMAYVRNPVSSAHAVDVANGQLSAQDSVAVNPDGTVLHGRYGELSDVEGLPLEYLALLHPAAQGVSAVEALLSGNSTTNTGTVLVYGATQPSGLSATQMATSAGHGVVAVVDGQHSGSKDMMESLKAMIPEPGTAVPEEYAMVKANFRQLVHQIASGNSFDDTTQTAADDYLQTFKENLMDYTKAYPDTLPAALSADYLDFAGKEKDRKHFRDNMETYLSQFPQGASPIDPQQLHEFFTTDHYKRWKAKFNAQTTAVITGDDNADEQFNPANLVKDMMMSSTSTHEEVPDSEFFFDILQPIDTSADPAGPIMGAIIVVTPELQIASDALAKATTLREKAEALQFLTDSQKNAYAAASSVANMAKLSGKPIQVINGNLPGYDNVTVTNDHVQQALSAMGIQDDGTSILNYYIQVYRAGDYPVYADYAIHRASEELAGPRQIIVTK